MMAKIMRKFTLRFKLISFMALLIFILVALLGSVLAWSYFKDENKKLAETLSQELSIVSYAMSAGLEFNDAKSVEDAVALLRNVKEFVGVRKPEHYLLNFEKPITVGALDLQDYYFEHRRQLAEAMKDSKDIILEVAKDFNSKFGRSYGLFETYKLDDADYAIIAMGSTAGTTKVVVDTLRQKGIKAGLLKPRVFRPFPKNEIADVIKNVKAIAVLDRSDTISGNEGPLCIEIKAALFDKKIQKDVLNYIYGLGGREIKLEDIETVYKDLEGVIKGKAKEIITYLGVRE